MPVLRHSAYLMKIRDIITRFAYLAEANRYLIMDDKLTFGFPKHGLASGCFVQAFILPRGFGLPFCRSTAGPPGADWLRR